VKPQMQGRQRDSFFDRLDDGDDDKQMGEAGWREARYETVERDLDVTDGIQFGVIHSLRCEVGCCIRRERAKHNHGQDQKAESPFRHRADYRTPRRHGGKHER
jgi:putative salt-induced outer membrane protein YdiY